MAINIVIPDSVVKSLNALPKEIRIKFWEQLERLITNPSYPGLRNEKLKGTDHWAFSIYDELSGHLYSGQSEYHCYSRRNPQGRARHLILSFEIPNPQSEILHRARVS